MSETNIELETTYADRLGGLYIPWQGDEIPMPEFIKFNDRLADELGLATEKINSADGAAILSGCTMLENSKPLAMAYAGHQFGGFAPILGDGRALLLGEIRGKDGVLYDLHLKGSGPTPFTRGGDGKAAIGPVLREYLISEAIHALGIPTSRSLAAILTGEKVYRETILPGAVLARVAKSHIRIGTFQFFAARRENEKLKRLADYSTQRHFPNIEDSPEKYLNLLRAVIEGQALLVSKWMAIGFVHGVMNTDNTTISGETIDYGPCAFLDGYSRNAVFSSIDTMGRYAFGNQSGIAKWNLARFAECLLPLLDEDEDKAACLATEALEQFQPAFQAHWLDAMRQKLGLLTARDDDLDLANGLFFAIENHDVDFTLLFRGLTSMVENDTSRLIIQGGPIKVLDAWLEKWRHRISMETADTSARITVMNAANPIYIPRNHLVEETLEAASRNLDMEPFDKLLSLITNPYSYQENMERYEQRAPVDFGPYRTFCGT